MILHQSLPPLIWDLSASQPFHFKILKETQGPSGNTLRCRAMKSSMLDMNEVFEGALP